MGMKGKSSESNLYFSVQNVNFPGCRFWSCPFDMMETLCINCQCWIRSTSRIQRVINLERSFSGRMIWKLWGHHLWGCCAWAIMLENHQITKKNGSWRLHFWRFRGVFGYSLMSEICCFPFSIWSDSGNRGSYSTSIFQHVQCIWTWWHHIWNLNFIPHRTEKNMVLTFRCIIHQDKAPTPNL